VHRAVGGGAGGREDRADRTAAPPAVGARTAGIGDLSRCGGPRGDGVMDGLGGGTGAQAHEHAVSPPNPRAQVGQVAKRDSVPARQ